MWATFLPASSSLFPKTTLSSLEFRYLTLPSYHEDKHIVLKKNDKQIEPVALNVSLVGVVCDNHYIVNFYLFAGHQSTAKELSQQYCSFNLARMECLEGKIITQFLPQ